MTMPTLQTTLSGDSTTIHAGIASALGGSAATIVAWGLSLVHAAPPSNVEVALGVILSFAASWLMQKVSG